MVDAITRNPAGRGQFWGEGDLGVGTVGKAKP